MLAKFLVSGSWNQRAIIEVNALVTVFLLQEVVVNIIILVSIMDILTLKHLGQIHGLTTEIKLMLMVLTLLLLILKMNLIF